MKQKTIEDVLRALENLGYKKPDHHSLGFTFQRNHATERMADIDWDRNGKFVVTTVSSHWTTDEADEFTNQLIHANENAKTLNFIIKRSENDECL